MKTSLDRAENRHVVERKFKRSPYIGNTVVEVAVFRSALFKCNYKSHKFKLLEERVRPRFHVVISLRSGHNNM